MKNVIFQINEETAKKRLFYGNLLYIIGFVTFMLLKAKLTGMCFIYAATLITTQALWFGKPFKLPKWIPHFMLFASAVMSGLLIVLIIGKVFFQW